MKSAAYGLLVFASILLPQQRGLNQEKSLRNRADIFYSMYSSGRNDGMWNMLSARLKKGNDNNKKKYLSGLPKPGTNHIEVRLVELDIDGRRAIVRLRLTIVSKNGDEIGWEDHDDFWVLERRLWRFDGSTTTNYKDKENQNRGQAPDFCDFGFDSTSCSACGPHSFSQPVVNWH